MADENKKAVEEADTSKTTKSDKKDKKEKKVKKQKKHFFKDLKGETKKIVWPGRKMVIKSTGIVIAAILVIGSEGDGMSRIVREKCDFIVSLKMKGQINSLNASVAGGILMYEFAYKR